MIEYGSNPQNIENSRGANQGEWIIATSDSPIFYIASKDASPCVMVFIHGKNLEKDIFYGCVAHVSVAEKIDSLQEMIQAMDIDWSTASAFLISGKSSSSASICVEINNLLIARILPEKIKFDLGNKTTKAVMDIRGPVLYKEEIPGRNYSHFDPDAYFRAACVGIFFPERKRSLVNSFDSRKVYVEDKLSIC
jgi:hypothetical protein